MDSLLEILRKQVTNAIKEAFEDRFKHIQLADIAPCVKEEFGHYQCNSPLRLSRELKENPRLIAEKIINHFKERDLYSKIEIAGPGFINFTFSKEALSVELEKQSRDSLLGVRAPKKERMIVEFSSPNVAKELHVGHLRSTIIGDSLARLFEFLGHDVLRLNHIGDWGTQFGMLIAYMQIEAPQVLDGTLCADLKELMGWYRAAKKRFDEDPEFKRESQKQVVELQSGKMGALKAWEVICAISRQGYQEIYDLLGVSIEERGESFYNPQLKNVVEELQEKGLIETSDGAKCIFLEGYKNREGKPLPLMVQKSDGGYNYDTTDLAAIRYRIQDDRAKRIIYVTDLGQSLHFQMVFAAAELAGWLDPKQTRVDHVGFGLVLGNDGKKFKTRSGETEKLIDLLSEAIAHAKNLLKERFPDRQECDIEDLAKTLGIGAVKYADLASSRTKDYTFSYDRMLRFEGNTAVFLLYSYVRIQGIKRKAGAEIGQISLAHPSEVSLGLHLRRFGEVLEVMAEDLMPNRLTDYLYTLAEKFNAFFRDCHVVGTPEEGQRLALCDLTSKILSRGLDILGLKTVDWM